MKKMILSLALLALIASGAFAVAPVVDPGWSAFTIRASDTGSIPPIIQAPTGSYVNAIEFAITLGGQKAGLGTDVINGAQVSQISTLHVDRLDDVAASGSVYGPYFNIWVTDGLGNYAVIANEPSNAVWAADRWDVPNWTFLQTKICKVYETPNAGVGTSWVHTYALAHGWSGVIVELTFANVAGLTIAPPLPAYIQDGANAVGAGAPDELGTDIARGFNWIFGDTADNYVSGGDGFVVSNYTATAAFSVTNVTQGLGYGTISAAMAAAVAGDDITVATGTYNENVSIPVGVTLRSLSGAATTTIAGAGGAAVTINADNVEIDGFTITNTTGTQAIYAKDQSSLHIHNNIITNVGDGVTAAGVQSIAIVCSSVDVAGVVIEDNDFNNILGGPNVSMSAMSIGWSNGTNLITGLIIQNNTISHLLANTQPWSVGHGAYGILINHGTSTTGMTVAPQILNNTIDDVEGLWAHGIGLEGNTPNALVSGNVISNLVDHKSPSDAVAILVEDNASLGTVTVTGNTFSNVSVGIANVVASPDFVNAVGNNWGDVSGPFNPDQNPGGLGTAVYGHVLYTPWTGRTVTLVNDLGVDPSSKILFVDGYGFWEDTPAIGVDGDYAPGFDPGCLQAPGSLTKYGFAPTVLFGRTVTVGELYSITYSTKKNTAHVSPDVGDWFFQMYTDPYPGSPGGWYGNRINSEPYFSENLTETVGDWNKWDSAAGADNHTRYFDSTTEYFGSYTDGFLVDLTYDPAFSAQPIMILDLGLGSAWATGFDGLVDGLTIELVNGEKAEVNFISGNAFVTATPATNGPLMCGGETTTLTFSLDTDQYTPDVFGFNAVVRATGEVDWGTVTSLAPFGASTQFQTFDQGDGSYIISGTTVGDPLLTQPISGAGTTDLFTITFTTASEGTAAVTFDNLVLRDPNNQPIPVVGTGATIVVDCTAPAAVTDITAVPGNNKVVVSWGPGIGPDTATYEVFRGLWYVTSDSSSAYPEYDDITGDNTIPSRPSDRDAAVTSPEWKHVGDTTVGTTSLTDSGVFPAGRGVYYYEVFAVDTAGNGSAKAAANDRATNYWLGDVVGAPYPIPNPPTPPNGVVDPIDMNELGAHFGETGLSLGAAAYALDVGPTDDWSRVGIPTTDAIIDFEDLIVFSMNFGVVSAAKDKAPVSTTADLAWVTYGDGSQALRLVSGSGLKGLRVRANVPVGSVEAGQLLDDQSELTFLKNVGTNLDASVAVMGINQAFEGSGDLLIVRSGSGIKVEDLHITARGIDNSELKFTMDEASGTLTPRVFALNANYPNPFNPMTKISFSLPEAQDVRLAVYGVDGRKVATLVNGTQGAGLHEVVWTGRDDSGQTVASGMYFYRIDAGPYSQVNKMTLMK